MSTPLTYDAITRRCGHIPDWKIASIEKTGGTFEDLEIALAWAAGESDVMGEERKPLTGPALRLYQILMADQEEWEEDRD
jgi:hypothetical protein